MQFSSEQQIAFDKYVQGENIFITGPGGTGKSALIKHIQKDALERGIQLQVCALTGCAAVLLECRAKTIHSWSGIGLGNGTIEDQVHKLVRNRFKKVPWKETRVLVIDEVSMMSQKIFEMLDAIGKAIRRNSKPFGGIQLIFSGDFYQLPPVPNKDEEETGRFCFESPLWLQTFKQHNHISLTKIFRQNDDTYRKILNQVREGRLKSSSNELLLRNMGKTLDPSQLIRPTKLFPTRSKVDFINTNEMEKLTGEEKSFNIRCHLDLEMTNAQRASRIKYTREQIEMELLYLKGNLRCEENIKLKIGSQVMCIVNMELTNGDMLCNGSQGIVMDFKRVIVGLKSEEMVCPLVRFNTGYEMTMMPHMWPSENIPGIGVSQIPLILAWALTIHKSQGATLDVAEIDVGSGIFECGQTYVALSRVKSLEGLYLTSFDARRIKINRKVQEFYEALKASQVKTPIIEPVLEEVEVSTTKVIVI